MSPLSERQPDTTPELKSGARLRQRLIGGMVIVAMIALILPLWLDTGGLKSPTVQPVPTPPSITQPEQINIPAPSTAQMHTLANPPPAALPPAEQKPAPTEIQSPQATTSPAIREAKPAAESPKITQAPNQTSTAAQNPKSIGKEQPAATQSITPNQRPAPPISGAPENTHGSNQSAAASAPEKQGSTVEQSAIVPSSPAGEWVVQLGSFSDELNARALAKSVEEAGFRVNLSPLFAKKGTVWRVRVGPYKTRDQAIQTTVLLRERLGRDGLVMPNK